MINKYGFVKMNFFSQEAVSCKNKLEGCTSIINPGNICFIDTLDKACYNSDTSLILCQNCGESDRYFRKKAIERGEFSLPSDL